MLTRLKQNLPAIILFIFFACLYIYTAAPGVYDGDSGEITAVVNTLGLAHPTGFPLYIMTGKLFSILVPIGDVAYRLNIFSGLLTAIALVFVYYTLENLGNSSFSSLVASFVLGLGQNTIWSNATTARVYAMSLLFSVVLLFIFSKWRKGQKIKYLYWYGFIWGLSIGTHALMLVMITPFLFMLFQKRHVIEEKISILGKIILLTLAPAIQYIYLLFAYKRNGVVTWGSMASWDDFIDYITQREYAGKMFVRSFADLTPFFNKILSLLTTEFTLIFFAVSLFGLIFIFKKDRKLFAILALIILGSIGMMYNYGGPADLLILYRYIFLTDLILALSIAFGLDAMMEWMKIFKNNGRVIFFTLVIILSVSYQFINSYSYNNRRDVYIFEDFARNTMAGLEQGSILFTLEDYAVGPIWYLQSTGERNDIIMLSAALLSNDWYIKNLIKRYPDLLDESVLQQKEDNARMEAIILHNFDKRRVYSSFPNWDDYAKSNYNFVPIGTVYAILPKNTNINELKKLTQSNQSIWDKYILRHMDLNDHNDFMANELIKRYALGLKDAGIGYAILGFNEDAINFMERSLDINPDPQTKMFLEKIKTMNK